MTDHRASHPTSAKQQIVAASYNIQKAIGTDLLRRPERTLAVMSELAADIMVLQESDRRFGARLCALPLEMIAAHGWRPVDFDTRPASIGWHGNAVLVSPRVEILRHAILPIPALEPRGAVLADLRIAGRPLRVVGMHLDLSGFWRRRQVAAVMAHLARQDEAMPVLIMGDMNQWRLAAGAVADFGKAYRAVPTGPSFHARMPVAALDRIFVSPDLRVAAAGVHHSARSVTASDHLPVWVRLEWPAGA
ncbi:MAG: endonuclease/exonuclease/phosphatase family protein [Sandarakinorhabdus sp.]|nr:endonuclease/exonuclease/phosphatase family protein [Sandarakinorhabdus sp.]